MIMEVQGLAETMPGQLLDLTKSKLGQDTRSTSRHQQFQVKKAVMAGSPSHAHEQTQATQPPTMR